MNKSGWTTVEIMIVVIIIAIILGIGGCITGVVIIGKKTVDSVNEKGLKGTTEQIWNGPNTNKVEI